MKRIHKGEKTKMIVILLSNKRSLVDSFNALCRKNGDIAFNDAVCEFVSRFVDEGVLPDCLFDGCSDAYLPKPYNERLDMRIPASLKIRLLDKIDETLGIGVSELIREYIVQCVDKKKLL